MMRATKATRITAISAALLLSVSASAAAQTEVGGYTFEELVPPGAINVTGVAELPGGLTGVMGYQDDDGSVIWGSEDGGETWTTARLDISGNAVNAGLIAQGDRFIAVGSQHHEDPSQTTWVFTSPDAVDWELTSQIENAHITHVVPTPDGVAMLGLDFREAEGFGGRLGGHPTLWLSDDAAEWEAHEITTPLYGSDEEQPARLVQLARSDDGTWMATGIIAKNSGEQGHTTIWRATPEMEWTEVASPFDAGPDVRQLQVGAWTPAGFLFWGGRFDRGGELDDGGMWLTTDGADWERVADTGSFPSVETMATDGADIVAFMPAFESVITDPKLLVGSPMYTSTDATTWEHPAAQTLDGIHVESASFTPAGHLLITGKDITPCEGQEFFCVFEGGIPAVWVGTPS